MRAKEMQKQDILKLEKSLYQKAAKDIHAIIEENKLLRDRLFLAARGRGSVGTGGGGSDNELTNWDGTKKRNGWGM